MAFLVTTTPSVRPKNLCACPRPVHPNEAFQVGKWVPATPFSGAGGDRHVERERFRPPGNVALGCALQGAMGY